MRGQVALLRAIQQREIVRVGGESAIAIDNRILAASNQPLTRLVEQGRFRADLYYRLNNLTLVVPPLRERLDDLPRLIAPILASLGVQMNRGFHDLSPRFHDKLRRHAWPGNVRELQHVIAQAALLEDGPVLEGRHFSPEAGGPNGKEGVAEQVQADVREARLRRVSEALREAGGNKSQAAAKLGVTRKTLYTWLRELDGV
jgi:two-component system response regulator HydG